MNLQIYSDRRASGKAAAEYGAEKIRTAIRKHGEARIILATGASQFEMLEALVREPEIDWERVVLFHLDEYVGLSEHHPASFRRYIRERFLAKLPTPLKEVNLVNGESPDLHEFCRVLGRKLQEKPIDAAFIGIGENGHIAFNDPPADLQTEEPYLIVNLDEICRKQQLGEGWFPNLESVPKQAISMSVRQILKSRSIINTVPEKRKEKALRDSLEGTLSAMTPASVLRLHNDCRTFCDEAAAGLLSPFTKELCRK